MKHTNFPNQHQKNDVMPHINNFFTKEYSKAVEELMNSNEYELVKEEYMSTDDCQIVFDRIDSKASEKYVSYISNLVDMFYDKTKHASLDIFLGEILQNSHIIFNNLGIHSPSWKNISDFHTSKRGCTKKNYKEIISELVDLLIDQTINDNKVGYATDKLVKYYYPTKYNIDELTALIAMSYVSSKNDLEDVVMKNFNFREMIKGNA